MKLLVFEFATAMGVEDPSITAEGHAMLYGLLEDLKEYETYHLIPNGYETIKSSYSRKISVQGDLKEWLHSNIKDYDACLPVAPEEDNLLHDLTRIIEKQGVEVLGSTSNAVKITTNKFDMYNALKGKFPVIKTEQVFFNEKESIHHKKSLFNEDITRIAKPADGVSCSGVHVVKSAADLKMAQNHIKTITKLPYYLIQDYVPGVNASVSLLSNGETAFPLSLNFQDVRLNDGEINYTGGKVPFKHELSDIAMETAKNAVEYVDGLKGYVGVDMILNGEKVHLVEINSRLTTPYVALRRLINFNLGDAIIGAVHGELPSEVKINGTANFYKEGKTLRVSVLQ